MANLLALFWEGFEPVHHVQVDARTLRIRPQPRVDHIPRCSCCGRQVTQVHDMRWRQVRERYLFSFRAWLAVQVRRALTVAIVPGSSA